MVLSVSLQNVGPQSDQNVVQMNRLIQDSTLDQLKLIEPSLLQYAANNPQFRLSMFHLRIRIIQLNRKNIDEAAIIFARIKEIKQNIIFIIERTLNLLQIIVLLLITLTLTETVKVFSLDGTNITRRDYLNGEAYSATVNSYHVSPFALEAYNNISIIIMVANLIATVYSLIRGMLSKIIQRSLKIMFKS